MRATGLRSGQSLEWDAHARGVVIADAPRQSDVEQAGNAGGPLATDPSRPSSDLLVVSVLKEWTCAGCAVVGRELLVMEDRVRSRNRAVLGADALGNLPEGAGIHSP